MAGGIVVPLDGSRFAEAALPWAIRIARRDGRPITVAAVSELPSSLEPWSAALQQWEQERQTELSRYLAYVAKRLEDAGVPSAVVLRKGSPGHVLPQLIGELEAGLVVMSTHGHGRLSRLWLGSVSDRVLRTSGAPILLVRPDELADDLETTFEAAPAIRRIMIPLDGSERGETALRKSILLGRDAGSVELLLVRILGFPLPPTGPRTAELRMQVMRAEEEEARSYLDRVAAKIGEWGAKVTTYVSEEASPWTGIPDFAAAHGVDMIAMTTHGRGGAARALLGSVTERVLRIAEIPVMVFPPSRVELEHKGIEQLAGQIAGMP